MNILVVGSGPMGISIALSFSPFHNLSVYSRHAKLAAKNISKQSRRYSALLKSCPLPPPQTIDIIESLENISQFDLIIESIVEDKEAKQEVLRSLSTNAHPEAILVTNTSTISVNELSNVVIDPSRFLGCHFFNPPYHARIVEISTTSHASTKSISSLTNILTGSSFAYVQLHTSPGMIVNRALFLMINEAIEMLSDDLASEKDIDILFTTALGHPMGPLQLADFIGLDVCLAILTNLNSAFGKSKYAPSKLLKELVNSGHLGRKSGQGFYTYAKVSHKA